MAVEAQYQMEIILGEVPIETDPNYVGLYATLDDTNTPVPFAVMVEGNPFELFDDPTA